MIGTTETLPSSVASLEPPQTTTPTLEVLATTTTTTSVKPSIEQTMTASPTVLAIEGQTTQSLESNDDGA